MPEKTSLEKSNLIMHHTPYQWCEKHGIMEPVMNCTNLGQYLIDRYGIHSKMTSHNKSKMRMKN